MAIKLLAALVSLAILSLSAGNALADPQAFFARPMPAKVGVKVDEGGACISLTILPTPSLDNCTPIPHPCIHDDVCSILP